MQSVELILRPESHHISQVSALKHTRRTGIHGAKEVKNTEDSELWRRCHRRHRGDIECGLKKINYRIRAPESCIKGLRDEKLEVKASKPTNTRIAAASASYKYNEEIWHATFYSLLPSETGWLEPRCEFGAGTFFKQIASYIDAQSTCYPAIGQTLADPALQLTRWSRMCEMLKSVGGL
ncbi:hypothetical protein BDQ17DRAFT_1322498 [Cyathus striatus]|nr:hypothetical protein BDQ17DRAFT_1322498 [Cyathus striatus]